jgi:NAD(P)-dependent dehydrogenase (short-subunit alcohol dehydrogenase family)
MTSRFAGHTVLVTGGASGIGRAAVLRFASEGAFVVVADISDSAGEALVAELGAERARFVHCDVSSDKETASCVATAIELTGRLDVLMNNAGIYDPVSQLDRIEVEAARRLFGVLLLGPMLMTRHALAPMRMQKRGVVINTASVTGIAASGVAEVYGPLKAALIHWSRCLAVELAPDGIRVNALSPGGIATAMVLKALEVDSSDEEGMATIDTMMAAAQPLQRAGQPEDLAAAAAFLASDDASWITGHNLVVDGGWTAAPVRAA